MAIWPDRAFSCDLKDWRIVAAELLLGSNPYVQPDRLLNWPPMWMEILYGIAKLCDRFDWHIFTVLRVFLSGCDAILVLSVCALLRLFDLPKSAGRIVLIGLCVNPFLILLTIQQGNFDVIPAIAIVWFIYFLVQFRREHQATDSLLAAAFLGFGGFAKTFPLALLPLLVIEARRLPWKVWILGAGLAFGPILLSLFPLFVLFPADILDGVIHYRGTAGPMGMSGLIQLIYGLPAVPHYSPIFTDGLMAAMCLITIVYWFRPFKSDQQLVLLAFIILLGILEFGSGYCAQYWMWVWPPAMVVYAFSASRFRRVLFIGGLIVVLTYIPIFAYNAVFGSFMALASSGESNQRLLNWFASAKNNILVCIPMTIAALVMWAGGIWQLIHRNALGRSK